LRGTNPRAVQIAAAFALKAPERAPARAVRPRSRPNRMDLGGRGSSARAPADATATSVTNEPRSTASAARSGSVSATASTSSTTASAEPISFAANAKQGQEIERD
jgi:hypothetical protein